jgi:hypothetical protein
VAGLWDFKTSGNLGCRDVGVNSVEGPDPPVPASAYNVSPRVSVDPSRVLEFRTLEVWSGVI